MKFRSSFFLFTSIFGGAVGFAGVPVGPFSEILRDLNGAANGSAVVNMFRQNATAVPSPFGISAIETGATDDRFPDFENFSVEEREFLYAQGLFKSAGNSEVGRREALEALTRFATLYPASTRWSEAIVMTGDCCFIDGDYQEALRWYSTVNPDKMTMDSRARTLYAYRLCVTRLMNGLADNETAVLLDEFASDPEYLLAGRYYRAYYDYLNRRYDAAYAGFEDVATMIANGLIPDEGMAPQYYMVQILYRNGKYDEVIKYGRPLMKRHPVERLVPEMYRVIGLSYFKTGDLPTAGAFLGRYLEEASEKDFTPADDAVYSLGVCEYEQGELPKSEARFAGLTSLQDMIGQGSWYHLGEIAMKQGRYDEAVIDFSKAAKMSYDPRTAERAAYNCIAAVTHGGRSPFRSTTAMYEEFLSQWPESRYADDVRQGLYQAYAAQSDYDEALNILNRISRPDARVMAEKQRLLYAKGTRQERAGRHKEGAATLREAVNIATDPALTAEASLWLGDALFGAGDYAASVKAYDKALSGKSGVKGDREITALYQRGYSNMKSGRYSEAARDFSEVVRRGKGSREVVNDARLRLADCQYYSGNLKEATETYKEVRELDGDEGDYATLRLALLAGLQGDRESETAMLRDFLRNSSDSPARAEAMAKLGASLEARGLGRDAISVYDDLLKEFPGSTYAPEVGLKSARLSGESGNMTEAVRKYKMVIERWPRSEEAAEADLILRDHYASTGELEEYVAYLSTVKDGPRIRESEIEDITFKAAEREYVASPDDVKGLKAYLAKYPHGEHVSTALLWIANSAFDNGKSREALESVERILAEYPESVEADDARLLKEDLGEYSELFEAVNQIESQRDAKRGIETLKKLGRNPDSAVGAQANVELGEWLLKAGRNKDALAQMSAFTSSGTEQQYWLARGFLVLADIHYADGKTSLAKEYITALSENYPGTEEDISEGIRQRLSRYTGEEKAGAAGTKTRKSRKRK